MEHGSADKAVDNTSGFQIQQEVPYMQGDQAGEVMLVIATENAPMETFVTFTSLNYEPPVYLPPTKVTNSRSFQAGVSAWMPAGAEFMIQYTVFNNQVPPPPDMSVSLKAYFVVPSGKFRDEPVISHVYNP